MSLKVHKTNESTQKKENEISNSDLIGPSVCRRWNSNRSKKNSKISLYSRPQTPFSSHDHFKNSEMSQNLPEPFNSTHKPKIKCSELNKSVYGLSINDFIDDLEDSDTSDNESLDEKEILDLFDENNDQISNHLKELRKEFAQRKSKKIGFKDDDEDEDSDEPESLSDVDLRLKYLREKINESILLHHNRNMSIGDLNIDLYENNQENVEDLLFYERVLDEKQTCAICCELKFVNERTCCGLRSCNECINIYIQTKIKESCGIVKIECLNCECKKLIHRDEINDRMSHFDDSALKAYLKFLIEANKDSNCKTCPRCSHVIRMDEYQRLDVNIKSDENEIHRIPRKLNKIKEKLNLKNESNLLTKVQCIECHLVWCFQCHSPWHDGISCSQFRKGDKMLKYWAKEVHYGQLNAQCCPKCKVFIQRTKGCDHMVCTFCQTEFCYKCGCKFRKLKFVGKLLINFNRYI